MITKKQFLQRLQFILDYEKAVEKYDQALKEFAHSDFTGYYDEKLHTHLLSMLAEDMNDEDDVISWWLYDCPEAGKHPEHANIWDGDIDDPNTIKYTIATPEDLYDYLFIQNSKAPSKETMRMTVKAQDTGVKFALHQIALLKEKNKETKNNGWDERLALLDFTLSKIKNEYLLHRGVGADLNYSEPFTIISILEDES